MAAFVDRTGNTYGRLTVIERAPSKKRVKWMCSCSCGNNVTVDSSALHVGNTTSCGCFKNDVSKKNGKNFIKHGKTNTPIHLTWMNIHRRCRSDPYYVSRGTTVCQEWDKYEAFEEWAIKNGFNNELTIDRKDNSLGYSPENCRFISKRDQTRNRTTTKLTPEKAQYIRSVMSSANCPSQSAIAKELGVCRQTISDVVRNKRWRD